MIDLVTTIYYLKMSQEKKEERKRGAEGRRREGEKGRRGEGGKGRRGEGRRGEGEHGRRERERQRGRKNVFIHYEAVCKVSELRVRAGGGCSTGWPK